MIEPTRAEMRAELHRMQGGKCALCPATSRLEVDHDHETGLVRGLLCKSCNVREGVVRWSKTSAEIKVYRTNPPAAALKWLWKFPDWWSIYDFGRAKERGLSLIEYIDVVNVRRRAEAAEVEMEAVRVLNATDLPALGV